MVRSPLIGEYVSTTHIIVRIFIADSRNRKYKGVLKDVRSGELWYKILTLNTENGPGTGRSSIVKINRFKHKIMPKGEATSKIPTRKKKKT